jgi:hypothetical protein
LIVGKNSIVIGEDCPKEIVGKSGEYCFVYDVCVSLDSLEQDQAHLDQVSSLFLLFLLPFLLALHSLHLPCSTLSSSVLSSSDLCP